MKHLLTLVLLCPLLAFTQITDDFSDGNLTHNPPWTGDVGKFIVNDDFQLKLNDSEAGESSLITTNTKALNCEWRIWIKLPFSPSTNNNAKIYLTSNNSNLSGDINGYFIQLGESGSNDALELFKQNGSEIISLCRGNEGLISSSFELGLKVSRDENNLWTLYADPNGGENYQYEAEAYDNSYTETEYFGFYCKYTSSNSSKFYFDNIYVGDIIIDTSPPELSQIRILNDSAINLFFDEVLDVLEAENINNYFVNKGFGNPLSAKLSEVDAKSIKLIFSNKFISGEQLNINISNIEDLSGNVFNHQEFGFMYFVASAYDILINEIMADPSPNIGLPEFEYLELYNSLPHKINLNDWKLIIGSSEKPIGDINIEANSYLILAKDIAESSLKVYGDFYGFSSFSLTNSSQDLTLISNTGKTISSVSYTDDWYMDPNKQEGGWSLEQINANNICSGSENWKASKDIRGGSPGEINSVTSDLKLFPELLKFELLDSKKIQIVFNQSMDSLSITNKSLFTVNNGIGEASSCFFSNFKPRNTILTFNEDFQLGKIYEMTISNKVKNCNGDNMKNDTLIVFGIPEEAIYMDLIINEVLFNPLGNGVDFVEIVNPSFKVIDLNEVLIGSIKNSPPNPPDTTIYSIINEQSLIVPMQYLCLSSSPAIVKEHYFTNNSNGFLKVDPFPPLNNDKGYVFLITKSGIIIDGFNYNEEMHYPLLSYVDGVSLERTSFLLESDEQTNWHSAAESVGFATPAYQNSQFIVDKEIDNSIVIDPEIFSPDNDAYNDLLSINYTFDKAGYMINIDIYNSNGYLIRKLVNNQYIGISGAFIWDGIKDDNTKANVGIYVVHIQVFDLDGKVKQYKKTAVLATKL